MCRDFKGALQSQVNDNGMELSFKNKGREGILVKLMHGRRMSVSKDMCEDLQRIYAVICVIASLSSFLQRKYFQGYFSHEYDKSLSYFKPCIIALRVVLHLFLFGLMRKSFRLDCSLITGSFVSIHTKP